MLDRYLEGLVKEAKKQERTETLSYLDMDDLAKVAGIRTPLSMCPKCGDAMTKTAGYLRCTCGVMKRAGIEQEALGAPGGGGVPLQMVHRTSIAPITAGEASGERKGRRVGALAGMGAGGLAGAAVAPLSVWGGLGERATILAAHAEGLHRATELGTRAGRRSEFMRRYPDATRMPGKVVPELERVLAAGGARQAAERAAQLGPVNMPSVLKMLPKSTMGKVLLGAGGALGAGALAAGLGGGVGRMVGGEIGQTIGGGVSPTTTKVAGVDLLTVGDAAGRILAKMAAAPQEIEGVPVEELKESIEEARDREDVPGRAKRWSIGSGIGGGLAGGAAGYGLGHLLTRGKSGAFPWLARIGGTALGGAAGGAGGAFLGHRHGAEEAEADQLLESIRARNAFGTGAQTGYHQGAQSGYLSALEEMNQGQGGDPFQGR